MNISDLVSRHGVSCENQTETVYDQNQVLMKKDDKANSSADIRSGSSQACLHGELLPEQEDDGLREGRWTDGPSGEDIRVDDDR